MDIRQAVGGYRSSAKIDAMIRHIRDYRKEKHKTVVFSQFTGFLDLIELALKKEGFSFVRLDGSLSQSQRENVLAEFANPNNKVNILLISLRAGGVGLNLTCATRILMMVYTQCNTMQSCSLLILITTFRILGGIMQWKHKPLIVSIV